MANQFEKYNIFHAASICYVTNSNVIKSDPNLSIFVHNLFMSLSNFWNVDFFEATIFQLEVNTRRQNVSKKAAKFVQKR